jgi:uncharacterized protein YukE
MNTLENIEQLVERLAEKAEALLEERKEMIAETERLRACLVEQDKEAVKISQGTLVELEAIQTNSLRFEQERIRIETRLQDLNDRLAALVSRKPHGD